MAATRVGYAGPIVDRAVPRPAGQMMREGRNGQEGNQFGHPLVLHVHGVEKGVAQGSGQLGEHGLVGGIRRVGD